MSLQNVLVRNPPSPFGFYLGSASIEKNLILENVIPVASIPSQTLVLGIDNSGGPLQGYVGSAFNGGDIITGLDPVANPGTPNVNAASIVLPNKLRLEPASDTFPGVVSMFPQTMGAGQKDFADNVYAHKDLLMNNTTTDGLTGLIEVGDTRIHNFTHIAGARHNFFAGNLAGNLTNSSTDNVGIGASALANVTIGNANTCINSGNAVSDGTSMVLIQGGKSVTRSNNSVVIGNQAGNATTIDLGINTLVGYKALTACNNGATQGNTSIGAWSGSAFNSAGINNTFLGAYAGANLVSGNSNVFIGDSASGSHVTAGDGNIMIGVNAGDNITTGNGNIVIGSNNLGPSVLGAVNGGTWIGTGGSQQTYITGITGIVDSNPLTHVMVAADDRLSSIAAMMYGDVAFRVSVQAFAANTPKALVFDGTITPAAQSYYTLVGAGPTYTQITVNRTGLYHMRYAFYVDTINTDWLISLGIGGVPVYVTESYRHVGATVSAKLVVDGYIVWKFTAGDIIQLKCEATNASNTVAAAGDPGSWHISFLRNDSPTA